MGVRLEDEIVRYGVIVGLTFACSGVKEQIYKRIVNNAIEVLNNYGFGEMLAYILYEIGEGRLQKDVGKKIVSSLLEFKDKTRLSDKSIILEIFKIASMTYKVLHNKKQLCRRISREIDLEKVISLIT